MPDATMSREQRAAYAVFARLATRFPALALLDPQIPREFVAEWLEARADGIVECVRNGNGTISVHGFEQAEIKVGRLRAEAAKLRERKSCQMN